MSSAYVSGCTQITRVNNLTQLIGSNYTSTIVTTGQSGDSGGSWPLRSTYWGTSLEYALSRNGYSKYESSTWHSYYWYNNVTQGDAYQYGTTGGGYGNYSTFIPDTNIEAGTYWGYTRRTINNTYTSLNHHRVSALQGVYEWYTYDLTMIISKMAITQTTGTSYLTRSSTSSTVYYTRSSTYDTVYYTRSSTYSTVYHTRSSTSGYSGVSSSSSETSGWQ